MGEGRRKARWLGAVVACGLAGLAACSQASPSSTKNPGDDLIVDVEASTMLPQPDAADYDDGFFNGTDGPYGGGYAGSTGYAVITICPPPDASAGASGDAAAAVDATAVAYGDASAAYGDGGWGATYGSTGTAASCTPMPAACSSKPDCNCLFTAFNSSLPCTYPHCEDAMSGGFTLYCPP
jgi:hypothetical protein